MRFVSFSVLVFLAAPAAGQSAAPSVPAGVRPIVPEGWTVSVGVAPVANPAWQGSRDMAVSVFPDLRITYDELLFASLRDGVGLNLINSDGWRAGPLVKVRFGRDDDGGGSPFQVSGGSDALLGLGTIKSSGEAGAFVEHSFGPREQWRLRAEVRQGFGGHDGVIADVAFNHRARIGRTIVSGGPRASFASRDFMQTYFGVTSAQALRTGLASYAADGGVLSYGVGGTLIRPLGDDSTLTLFTSLERLGKVAADSPLVRERGQRTQFSIGLGYSYRFSL